MSLYGAFDKTKHFSELGDPLATQGEGVISAATRRQTALRNLTGDSNFTIAQLNVLSNVTPGTAAASKALVLSSTSSLSWAASSALTSAVKLLTYALTATGAGATVDGVLFSTTTAVALGDYANAINGKLDFGSAGRVTGLGGVICAELDLGAGCSQGSYACFEAELNMSAAGSLTGARTSIFSINVWGNATGVATFDTNGFLFDVGGITPAAGKFASLASQTLKVKVNSDIRYLVTGQLEDGLGLGNSGTPMTLTAAANHAVAIYTTSADATGTSVEPFIHSSVMTGPGGTGGRALFQLDTNVALGGWSNALKAIAIYGSSGKTTGLGSAFCAELTMSAGTTAGTYAPVEIELNLGSNAPVGTHTSLIYAQINGTATAFLSTGSVINIAGAGGDLFQASAKSAINATHALKFNINGTAYYLPLHTSAGFGV